MDKIFNQFSIFFGVVFGVVINLLGGNDVFLEMLIIFVILDYISGLIKGIITKQLSSNIGYKGLLKKVMIFIIVALSVSVERMLNNSLPVREIVIMFYLSNEAISILENAGAFLPIPKKLQDILLQLRKEKE